MGKHYAVFIGINFYPDTGTSLKGCVRDVQEIAKYLDDMLIGVDIDIFTASTPEDPNSSRPTEDPKRWPTYSNVTSRVREITSGAEPGDFVHIHYSGHGTTIESVGHVASQSVGDLALVLLEETNHVDIRYLHGTELAFLLRDLIAKKLTVSLVLDCCFSGSVLRNDRSVRYLRYDPNIDAAYPLPTLQSIAAEDEAIRGRFRDASMRLNWLADPDGYTILTACGPHEIARELELASGQRHGALSYFLLRTLAERNGLGKRQRHIYHHLCARFRESWPRQNPMFYGNMDQCFLSRDNIDANAVSIQAVKQSNGSLRLQAGQAHGVYEGDEFATSPMGSVGIGSQDTLVARVSKSRIFESDLQLLSSASTDGHKWWTAIPLTRFCLLKVAIRLSTGPQNRVEWLAALGKRSLKIIPEDESPHAFHVTLNEDQEYEILDSQNQRVANLPTLTQDETDTSFVLDVIEHLAKFSMVKGLGNEASSGPFQQSFAIRIIDQTGHSYQPGSLIEVEHNERVTLVMENKGNSALYIYLYDMGPCWQIENMQHGNHRVLPPQRGGGPFVEAAEQKVKLRMKVSSQLQEQGSKHCDDIIKIFVTSQLTSFDSLELPKIGESVKRNRTDRAGREEGGHSSEAWAGLNFFIRTFLK